MANGIQRRLPVINIITAVTATCSAPPNRQAICRGETSMAYYGTPKQVAKINGDRAYESDLAHGRTGL